MPTSNLALGLDWVRIASATDAGFLASTGEHGYIEYATTADDVAPPPTLRGHVFAQAHPVGRGDLGPGYVWARVLPPDVSSVLVVTK
jgi:hypothetical protein